MARLLRVQKIFIVLILSCFTFGCIFTIISVTSIDQLGPLFGEHPDKLSKWTSNNQHKGASKDIDNKLKFDNQHDALQHINDAAGGHPKVAAGSKNKKKSEDNQHDAVHNVDEEAGALPKVAAGMQMTQKSKDERKPVLPIVKQDSVHVENVDKIPELLGYPEVNYNVHVFYYPWYGNPKNDGKYIHWNHGYIEHWNKREAQRWPVGRHQPPNDIGANFYPELGCYSSKDKYVIDNHMQQIRSAGIGVVVVSWYPNSRSDAEGIPSDSLMPSLLDAAHKYQLKVAVHSEPYKERDDSMLHDDMKYLITTYGKHPAFYKYEWKGKQLPLIYVYDSYLTKSTLWKRLLKPDGAHSIRGTDYDAVFIALLVELKHKTDIVSSGFDGFYTYFATSGFTYGSTYQHWDELSKFAKHSGLLFIPSLGPGYIDTSIRPWNAQNKRQRLNGQYYENAFKQALDVNPAIVSITSFNEWHEGTQIEKAVPKKTISFTYLDYKPYEPDYYLKLTRKWVDNFTEKQRNKKRAFI
ncbi:glycoprotein endo-alpha-1,2-mannosidase-like [Glandiceps talaboti]